MSLLAALAGESICPSTIACGRNPKRQKARTQIQKNDGDKKIFDSFYYHLLDHDTGNTYIFLTDYQYMRGKSKENTGKLGVLYKDPDDPKRTIIRCYDGADIPQGARTVLPCTTCCGLPTS